MKSSRRGPASFNPFANWISCPTPGPTGKNDFAEPLAWLRAGVCRFLGDSPGPLGKNDLAAELTSPINPDASVSQAGAIVRWRDFIVHTVGRDGVNELEDVCLIQERLNKHMRPPSLQLFVSGLIDDVTLRAIEDFQKRVVKLKQPDGLISPGGKTDRALSQEPSTLVLSGKSWKAWADVNAQNSSDLEKLVEPFKANLKDFIAALEAGGATVDITATRRDAKRAYLFHWSWKIALAKCKPEDATTMTGVPIEWDHGDLAKSKAAANEMVTAFGLAIPPSSNVAPALSSNHIAGKAVDMEIAWSGKLKFKKKDGTEMEVAHKANVNLNTDLHALGETYGVKKHLSDAPHWSINGL